MPALARLGWLHTQDGFLASDTASEKQSHLVCLPMHAKSTAILIPQSRHRERGEYVREKHIAQTVRIFRFDGEAGTITGSRLLAERQRHYHEGATRKEKKKENKEICGADGRDCGVNATRKESRGLIAAATGRKRSPQQRLLRSSSRNRRAVSTTIRLRGETEDTNGHAAGARVNTCTHGFRTESTGSEIRGGPRGAGSIRPAVPGNSRARQRRNNEIECSMQRRLLYSFPRFGLRRCALFLRFILLFLPLPSQWNRRHAHRSVYNDSWRLTPRCTLSRSFLFVSPSRLRKQRKQQATMMFTSSGGCAEGQCRRHALFCKRCSLESSFEHRRECEHTLKE